MWRCNGNPASARTPRPVIALVAPGMLCALSGCIQEMANQPRYDALEGRVDQTEGAIEPPRQPVAGTIPRGHLPEETSWLTGRRDGEFLADVPEEALRETTPLELVQRGRVQFNAMCSHCHGRVGGGTGGDAEYEQLTGMVVKAGFPPPPTFHQPRLREAPLGQFVNVIAKGRGEMPAHAYLVKPADRWAIAAYIRALQLSHDPPAGSADAEDADVANLGEEAPRNG